ncbi:MAG: hypothetical protein ACI4X9_03650 [Kiritimatiellia bacterium]
MKRLFFLFAALLGSAALAAPANWCDVSDWWRADGYFHTGFGATTTASFSVGAVFNVPDLAAFTADAASKMLLGVRNSGSSDNAGPSFELWTDGDVKGKICPQMEGEGYTVTGDSTTTYGERGWADVNVLLKQGLNHAVITVELFEEGSDLSAHYTLYINGTMVVEGFHFGINADVYDYENLAAISGAKVYYRNGIASEEEIRSLLTYPTYIPADASEATKAKFDAWDSAYNNNNRDAENAQLDAFLLNVAPADAAAEMLKFQVTAIAVEADGTVAVTAPTQNSAGKEYNGTVVIKGKTTLDEAAWAEKDDKTHHFFKAFLELH